MKTTSFWLCLFGHHLGQIIKYCSTAGIKYIYSDIMINNAKKSMHNCELSSCLKTKMERLDFEANGQKIIFLFNETGAVYRP